MKKLAIFGLALMLVACSKNYDSGQDDVIVTGNGFETCTKAEPCDGIKPQSNEKGR